MRRRRLQAAASGAALGFGMLLLQQQLGRALLTAPNVVLAVVSGIALGLVAVAVAGRRGSTP